MFIWKECKFLCFALNPWKTCNPTLFHSLSDFLGESRIFYPPIVCSFSLRPFTQIEQNLLNYIQLNENISRNILMHEYRIYVYINIHIYLSIHFFRDQIIPNQHLWRCRGGGKLKLGRVKIGRECLRSLREYKKV